MLRGKLTFRARTVDGPSSLRLGGPVDPTANGPGRPSVPQGKVNSAGKPGRILGLPGPKHLGKLVSKAGRAKHTLNQRSKYTFIPHYVDMQKKSRPQDMTVEWQVCGSRARSSGWEHRGGGGSQSQAEGCRGRERDGRAAGDLGQKSRAAQQWAGHHGHVCHLRPLNVLPCRSQATARWPSIPQTQAGSC